MNSLYSLQERRYIPENVANIGVLTFIGASLSHLAKLFQNVGAVFGFITDGEDTNRVLLEIITYLRQDLLECQLAGGLHPVAQHHDRGDAAGVLLLLLLNV